MAEGEGCSQSRQQTGGQNITDGCLGEGLTIAKEKSADEQDDHQTWDQPGKGLGYPLFFRDGGDFGKGLWMRLLGEQSQNAGNVRRPHHRHDPGAGGIADLMGHVEVALVDQNGFDRRQHRAHFIQHRREGIALPQPRQLGLVQFLVFEHPGNQGGDQVHPFPEPGLAPGPQQGSADLPIHQFHPQAPLLCGFSGSGQFRPRFDAGLQAHALLEGGQGQVGQQKRRLAPLDDLDQVQGFPSVLVAQGLQPLTVQFDTNRIGQFLGDDPLHGIDGVLGNMGGADQDDVLAVDFDPMNV